ncbi:hypothetical protein JXJ21_14115 [candidate division KSB1 bacterium]|nr:hypothetical protein [candidate division KSB1 bacterium]
MPRNQLLIKSTLIALILVIIATSGIIAQESTGTYLDGKADGQRDAMGNAMWILAGFGCGIMGVVAAYIHKPSPPVYALVGKSPEYVLGYTEGYQTKARSRNLWYASAGLGAMLVVSIAVLVLFFDPEIG